MTQAPQQASERQTFFQGDARDALRWFLDRGLRARVAYLDPPFLTGKDFGAYRDAMRREDWVELLRDVLVLCREALTEDGSLYLHIDHRTSAYARLLLDEVFGGDCFLNEIIWAYQSGGRSTRHYSRKHDTIFFYGRSGHTFFRPHLVGLPRGEARSNHMRRGVDDAGRAYSSIRTAGQEYRYYDDELVPPGDVWTDISHLQQRDPERTGYPTQKPLRLLERVLLPSSEEGDWVIDPFCGSGTTLHAAHRLGRRGFSADVSPASLDAVRARLGEEVTAVP